jgi:hypothetical protein
MSEVGALIIRLQAETAQFREELDKAKAGLEEFGQSGGAASEKLDYSMREARESIMLTGDAIGIHLPAGITRAIASIAPLGAVLETILPVAAIVAGTALIIEALAKLGNEAHKAAISQQNAGSAIAENLRGLDDKFLQVGIRIDDLNGNHMAALRKQIRLIDNETLSDLEHEFEVLGKVADAVFTDLKASMIEFGHGSEHAKWNLDQYQATYRKLLDTKGEDAANDYLREQLKYEQAILDAQERINKSLGYKPSNDEIKQRMDDTVLLDKAQVNSTEKELAAQRELVDVLEAQIGAKQKIDATSNAQKSFATETAHLKVLKDESEVMSILASGMNAQAAAARKLADTQAETDAARTKSNIEQSPDQRLAATLSAITREQDATKAAALSEYQAKAQLYEKDLEAAGQNLQKKKELEAKHVNDMRAYSDEIAQADATAQLKSVQAQQTADREKQEMAIAAAQAAADAKMNEAIKDGERQEKMAEQIAKNLEALGKRSAQQTADAEKTAVQQQVDTEVKAYKDRIAALDKFGKDYQKQVQELNAKIADATKKGAEQVDQIQRQADQRQLLDIRQAYDQMQDAIASTATRSILEEKNMAQAFEKTGAQMLESALTHLLEFETISGRKRLADARQAASDAYAWAGNPILGPILAAGAFAGVMAFEQGGKIPGEGAVPIIGHGGETVVTKALTDRVERSEANGGGAMHMHMSFAPHITAMDATDVDRVLTKHQTTFQRHAVAAMRRMKRMNK